MPPEPPQTDPHGRRSLRLAGRALVATAAAALIGLLAYGVLTQAPDTTIDDSLAAGQTIPAPTFDLEILQPGDPTGRLAAALTAPMRDGRLALHELRGTPVVLNFWASWCVPCRDEAPLLQHAWRRLARPRGVLLLGLDMQDVREDARAFMREFAISYPNIRDPTNTIARRYGATGIPETFFISAAGNVVGHVIGVVTREQLADGMQAAIDGRPFGAKIGGDQRPTR